MSLLGLLLLALPAPLQAPPPAPVQVLAQEPAAPSAGELQDALDRSLHWLRGRQREDGSYGGVWTTIQVLSAFAEGPRAYRPADGPFVARALRWLLARQAEDGAFDPGPAAPAGVDRRAATRAASELLARFDDEAVRAARARALEHLGPDGAGAAPAVPDDPGAAAARLLAQRAPDGSWDAWEEGPEATDPGEARTLATATRVVELNDLYRALEPARPAGGAVRTAQPLPAFEAADRARVVRAMERGAGFLLGEAQDGLWGFDGRPDPGITAMVAGALLALPEPRPAEVEAAIGRALDWLKSLQKEDGSIHDGQLASYVTSASVLALAAAGRPQDEAALSRARAFLEGLQADEGEGYSPDDPFYGGVGYGGDERPDLSNLQMALEALSAAGLEEGDPTFQKALVFLQRCQNRSESNDLALVRDGVTYASGNDGGAGYAPGDSKAGFVDLPDGRRVPRSYGSMTYALLKGYLFAGLPKDDPRVVAAWRWLGENYTLDVNPGFETASDPTAPYQGLFYYFATMARTLDLHGAETVTDAQGVPHAWRVELCGRLTAMQRQDGSWVNENAARWYEGNPVLATAYALQTLRDALPR